MPDYIQVEFKNVSEEEAEILIARLSNGGFDGFEQDDNSLKAFISSQDFDQEWLNETIDKARINYAVTTITETNWNELWESSFEPVIVDDFVAVRAHFHEPVKAVQHEIIITPKMSFGTGHHATTYMMMEQMRGINFTGKTVFDFGTGTGVLAILAEKLGAHKIIATDIDEWSIENAEENLRRNRCQGIEILKADSAEMGGRFDIILANINKNIIIDNFPALAAQLVSNGTLLLSGLLAEDEPDILGKAEAFDLTLQAKKVRNNWLSLKMTVKS